MQILQTPSYTLGFLVTFVKPWLSHIKIHIRWRISVMRAISIRVQRCLDVWRLSKYPLHVVSNQQDLPGVLGFFFEKPGVLLD